MKVKTLIEALQSLPVEEDWDIVLSKVLVIDEDEEIMGVLDIPIAGLASNGDDKEVRIVMTFENTEGIFPADDIVKFEKED